MYKAWVHRSSKHLHLLQLYKLGENGKVAKSLCFIMKMCYICIV